MESLQGGTLFYWESGEIVRRTDDVEAKNVLVQSDLTFFFCLGFLVWSRFVVVATSEDAFDSIDMPTTKK